jgi:xanthine dehydrogenase small subunit
MEEFRENGLLNDIYPGLRSVLEEVASAILRNRATLAGNIVNASPIGDISIILLAVNADIRLSSPGSSRDIPLKDFFIDYKKTELRKEETVAGFLIPLPEEGTLFHFEKVSRRKHLDIASVNSCVTLRPAGGILESCTLSVGGAAPFPLYAGKTSAFLSGKPLSPGTVRKAAAVLSSEISPIDDVRGSAAYKRRLALHLLYSHFMDLFPDDITWNGIMESPGRAV